MDLPDSAPESLSLKPHLSAPRPNFGDRAKFELVAPFAPQGDQPKAIEELSNGLERGLKRQTLLGATGTGKTFTVANVIRNFGHPTLVMAPNKTLAAQLYGELKELFPHNAVEYFVSYYDYYLPEAYIPSSDTYIEKDAQINEAIDRMRHAATRSLFERNDVIIVASVSCIYGLGTSEAYAKMIAQVFEGQELSRRELLERLVLIQYERNDIDFHRGTFRVRGDVVEIFPAYEEEIAVRVEFFGDEVESIYFIDPLRGKRLEKTDRIVIYPNTHYAVMPERKKIAIDAIFEELNERVEWLTNHEKFLEAQRLKNRTEHDMEMMAIRGYCSGIENYSRHLSGRAMGDPPPTLLDYFPQNFLTIIDESHVTVPQIGGMFRGDRSRKTTLVEHGFRLPSALDNRPLKFEEWDERLSNVIYVSATPGDYEIEQTHGVVVEQIIRPTGLLDPIVEVRPALEQVDDVYGEIVKRIEVGERVLVTTLTKRMSEDLTEYLKELNIRVRYLHSDIVTIERMNIIRDLRKGIFDVLVGINLLREGLDIPEVSLVAILDADKEGFLRSSRSLIQTIGRAARNAHGKVILYADQITQSMQIAIDETERRREVQEAYNKRYNITPKTVQKRIDDLEAHANAAAGALGITSSNEQSRTLEVPKSPAEIEKVIKKLRQEMHSAADDLKFEEAAEIRDKVKELEKYLLTL